MGLIKTQLKIRCLSVIGEIATRHSMLKMRLGALPETEVKMPQPLAKFAQPSPTMSVR